MFGDNITKLRSLAALKGYTFERAITGERWRLKGPKGNAALGRTGMPSFRYAEAMKFLRKQADGATQLEHLDRLNVDRMSSEPAPGGAKLLGPPLVSG